MPSDIPAVDIYVEKVEVHFRIAIKHPLDGATVAKDFHFRRLLV